MSSSNDSNAWKSSFGGLVRLFPLPNFVMFPGVVKGLCIFEPRYCAMLEESLSTDRLIAMALLKPGWESEYFQHPAIHDTVCIGSVAHHARTPDGRHNILLSGLKRARIVRESVDDVSCFRRAQVVLLEDDESSIDSSAQSSYRSRILTAFRAYSPAATLFSLIPNASLHELPLGLLVDLLSHGLPFSIAEKLALLAERNVESRIKILLQFLGNCGVSAESASNGATDDETDSNDSFPPRTSWN